MRKELSRLGHRFETNSDTEYVYNVPWSLKTFDGRKKSLLRHASKHVLPQSVVDRVKSPYPSTQDRGYQVAVQQQAKEVLAGADHPVFELVDEALLNELTQRDPERISHYERHSLDRILDLYHWFEIYRPELQL